MGRRLISWRIAALTLGPYAVLARLSLCYSPPKGRSPTCYAPVRRWYCYPLDLHVLSHPLAFALSQDQTLQFFRLESIPIFPGLSVPSKRPATCVAELSSGPSAQMAFSTGPSTVCFSKTWASENSREADPPHPNALFWSFAGDFRITAARSGLGAPAF